jgi:hypothetical protein
MNMKLVSMISAIVVCGLVCPALVGCGQETSDKPVPNKVETIGSNVEPSTYISVLESMSGPDRKKYIAEHKDEFDTVMSRATPDEKDRLESVLKLP